jgi:hypothetical protein
LKFIKNQRIYLNFKVLNFQAFSFVLKYINAILDIKKNSFKLITILIWKRKKLYTLLKSPHVNKKSRDQLFYQNFNIKLNILHKKNSFFGSFFKVLLSQKGFVLVDKNTYLI